MAELRQVRAQRYTDIEPNEIDCAPPNINWVDPAELRVDATYQRNLSDRSRSLIRKLISGWDWRAFKPPVVARVGDIFHILDGQHTAIAAASHPDIKTIPILVVDAAEAAVRASAFVKHNRDRIQVTPTQLHFALIEAGDEDALTLAQACDRAGVTILRNPPANAGFKPGETLAVSTMKGVLNRRHAIGLRRVIQVCANAKMSPVSAAAIRAVESLIFADEFAAEYNDEDLSTTIRARLPDLLRDASAFAAQHKVPIWRGLAVAVGRNTRKRRGSRKAA